LIPLTLWSHHQWGGRGLARVILGILRLYRAACGTASETLACLLEEGIEWHGLSEHLCEWKRACLNQFSQGQ
jgi:hypothetical protein